MNYNNLIGKDRFLFWTPWQSTQSNMLPGWILPVRRQSFSVIGTDMERFPTDSHISSWAGLCPGDNESAKTRDWKNPERQLSVADNIESYGRRGWHT